MAKRQQPVERLQNVILRLEARLCIYVVFAGAFLAPLRAPAQPDKPGPQENVLITISGTVETSLADSSAWSVGHTNEVLHVGDKVRTGKDSRAAVRLSDLTVWRLREQTTYELQPPQKPGGKPEINLRVGSAYFFGRDHPDEIQLHTPVVTAAIRGTEFNVLVREDGQTELALLEGKVTLSNEEGTNELDAGQLGTVSAGQPPRKSAILNATNIIQWTLYYPAILDPDDLHLSQESATALTASLSAYRSGDLLKALGEYPAGRAADGEPEEVYHAAVLLSVGEVEEAEALLRQASREAPLADALLELIAAVKLEPFSRSGPRTNATEWMAGSYAAQSGRDLPRALEMARKAATVSPNFGFAWERVAELEFSFGHTEAALVALKKSLELAPRNAQAHALHGFLLAAQNRITAAEAEFDAAIGLDGGLANAWLGRGLCRIKRGQEGAGREDLLTAAALEPNRSLLRSYLAKAFINAGKDAPAKRELLLARGLDTNDPTPLLYMALLDYQDNRANQAVNDLEGAEELNTNRQVYRSKLLLDQDQAVASTSLAKIYQNTGMNEVSLAEASRAVDYDYADYSAHLFLAESYDALRDPTRFDLRYETVWFNELLLANLLAPVGARPISQNISQQQYSRLLEEDRLGFDSSSQYRSDRQFQEIASQYGAFGSTSYSLDLTYQHNDGILHPYRTNNALSDIEWYSQIKQQVGPNDAVTLLTKYENYHSGDNFQYNNPANASPYYHYNEYETPILVGAWHHEWDPGIHTLFLVGRLEDDQTFSDRNAQSPVVEGNAAEFEQIGARSFTNFNYQNQFTIYTGEFNQIFQGETHTSILGARVQSGQFNTEDVLAGFPTAAPPIETDNASGFRRVSAYGYHTWEFFPGFRLTAGVAYDDMTYPDNFRFIPITAGETQRRQFSPKAALTWTPQPEITFRAAFAESISGATFDESFTLEPTQLAGFIQEYRSIVSESLIGSVAGAHNKIWGGAMDLKLPARTFLTVEGQWLGTDVNEDVGVFDVPANPGPPTPGTVPDHLRYSEPSVNVTINKLVGNDVSVGASYKFTDSTLSVSDPFALNLSPLLNSSADLEARLHVVDAYVQLEHHSGFFARADAQWNLQFNSGYVPGTFDQPLPRSEFAQVNLYAGYRFWHRRGEVTFGVLNVGGGDYSLNPLNLYSELPRSRVFMGRLVFNF